MKTNDLHIELPSSKSLSNRWLTLNHILDNHFVLHNLSEADDTQLMQTLLLQLRRRRSNLYYCKNAGTVARFMVALLAFTPGDYFVSGDTRLNQRPMSALINALRDMGCRIDCTENEGFLPVHIIGAIPQRKMVELNPSDSSQYVSAMMLAGTLLPNGITLTLTNRPSSRPYIDMTRAVLEDAGIDTSVSANRRVYRVDSATTRHPRPHQVVQIERDWSSASYIYAAAAILPGLRIRMPGLSLTQSCQGDRAVATIFEQLGVASHEVKSPYRSQIRSVTICGTGLHEALFEHNFIDTPDLLPAALVTCAALGIRAKLKGVKNLRIKESDRLLALQTELQKMGGKMNISTDEVHILPCELHSTPLICAHGDHRIAMAFAILTLRFPEMEIDTPEMVSKSFPGFWSQLALIRKAASRSAIQKKE